MTAATVLAYPGAAGTRAAAVFSPRGRSSAEGASDGVKILIVEDDFLAASEIEAVLTDAGYHIVGIANRAEEAVRLSKSEAPDLAIMDIRLVGEPDGIDAAVEIFRQTGIRCIFATAHHDARMRSRAQDASPLGWLPKPYAQHALIAMVEKAVAQL